MARMWAVSARTSEGEPTVAPGSVISSASIARNSLWNLLGQFVPMVAAVLCIPALVSRLGVERFGILTLMWVMIGYFSLFDLGLGRSLTKLVAERTGQGHEQETVRLVWTALLLLLLLSLLAGLLIVLLSPWLAHKVLAVALPLQNEVVASLRLLALGVPTVFFNNGLKGVLEAHGRFGLTNAVRIPMGVFNFVGPLVSLQFSQGLVAVIAVLIAGRLVTCAIFLTAWLASMPASSRGPTADLSLARPLMRLGGWMTVSNIVGPFMVYLDRFFIGALASTAVVAYYTTPYEVVTKLWLIPSALTTVLFPLFSRYYAVDRIHAGELFRKGLKYPFLCLFPPTLAVVVLAREGLRLWLGSEFARHSTGVAQCLSVGVLFGSFALVALAFLQGAGRPDLTAKVHLIELPLYLLGLRVLVPAYGVLGAAIVWLVRLAVDAVVLVGLCGRLLPESRPMIRRLAVAMAATVVTLGLATVPAGAATKAVFALGVLCLFGATAWFWVLTPSERGWVKRPWTARAEWLVR